MKLCSYVLNGNTINYLLDSDGYNKSLLGGNFPFIILSNTDPITTGYQDISSIENWAAHGGNAPYLGTSIDYKFVRKEIGILVITKGWTTLTPAEKSVAASWFVVAKTQRDELFTTNQQIRLGLQFHKSSITARAGRAAYAMMDLYNRLSKTDADTVINDISVDNLLDLYINTGREGTLEGDSEGLFDYIEARTGTKYAATGIISKAITPVGTHTLQQVVDHIMKILRDGNFSPLL